MLSCQAADNGRPETDADSCGVSVDGCWVFFSLCLSVSCVLSSAGQHGAGQHGAGHPYAGSVDERMAETRPQLRDPSI